MNPTENLVLTLINDGAFYGDIIPILQDFVASQTSKNLDRIKNIVHYHASRLSINLRNIKADEAVMDICKYYDAPDHVPGCYTACIHRISREMTGDRPHDDMMYAGVMKIKLSKECGKPEPHDDMVDAFNYATTAMANHDARMKRIDEALTKENQMITITTKTYINDVDVNTLTIDQLFDAIAKSEAEIAKLEAIKRKPKALVAKIETINAAIENIIAIIDGRTTAG